MITVDKLIEELKNHNFDTFKDSVPLRDIKILKNIASLMLTTSYITENQGKLLIKILKENQKFLSSINSSIETVVNFPTWDKGFRVQEKIRTVSIEKTKNSNFDIKIRYSFDKEVKKAISFLNKKIGYEGFHGDSNSQEYSLLEKNILVIHEVLKPLKFAFSEEFLDLYEKITSIDKNKVLCDFNFKNLFHDKISKYDNSLINETPLIILDRKIQYQYRFSQNFEEHVKNSLAYKIANREESKIFIPQYKYSINDIFKSLKDLKRDKILLIFDENLITECLKTLKNLEQILIDKKVGIYFRFDNKNEGLEFNQLISKNHYNQQLNDDTDIVGISNGKIPKFMLKNSWYPNAVITVTNSLRNNRSDVYCNDCDLIVYYTLVKPLITKINEIL